MKNSLYIALLSTAIAFMPAAHAFDFSKILSSTPEETAAAAVKEQKKEMVKTVAKESAHKVGVTEVDPYIDVAVDSADAVIDTVKKSQLNTASSSAQTKEIVKAAPVIEEEKSILDSLGSFFR